MGRSLLQLLSVVLKCTYRSVHKIKDFRVPPEWNPPENQILLSGIPARAARLTRLCQEAAPLVSTAPVP
jgi:hypothetical protein